MFRPKTTKTNTPKAGYRKMEEEELRAGLTEYVSKNKDIPAFYAEIENDKSGEHEKKLAILKLAIMEGDTEHEIFSDKSCFVYLLYLIQKGNIPFWTGMSAYNYLLGLAQFTNRQELKEEDNDVKDVRNIQMVNLVEHGIITEFGEEYLNQLTIALRKYGYKIDVNELKKFVCEMPALEQKLMRIPSHGKNEKHDVDVLLLIMKAHVFYCKDIQPDSTIIPSMTLINYIHSKMDDEYMDMKPIFGIISEATLNTLHARNQHPLAIYINLVRSNLKLVHTWRAGPVPAVIHDIGHVLWAIMLASNERSYIHNELLPALNDAIETCKSNHITSEIIEAITYKLNDYNISPINFYTNRDQRLNTYVYRIFNETLISPLLLMNEEEKLFAITSIRIVIDSLTKLKITDPKLKGLTDNLLAALEGCIEYCSKRSSKENTLDYKKQHKPPHKLNIIALDLEDHTKSGKRSKSNVDAHHKLLNHIGQSIISNRYDEARLMMGGNCQDTDIDKTTRNTSGFVQLQQLRTEVGKRLTDKAKCNIIQDNYLLADSYSQCAHGKTYQVAISCQEDGKYNADQCKEKSLSSYKSVRDASRLQTIYAQAHKQAASSPKSKIVYDYYLSDALVFKNLGRVLTDNRDLIPDNVTLRIHLYEGENEYAVESNLDESKVIKKPVSADKLITSTNEFIGTGKIDHNYEENIMLMMQCCRKAYPSVAYSTMFNAAHTFLHKPDVLKEFKAKRNLVEQKKENSGLRSGF